MFTFRSFSALPSRAYWGCWALAGAYNAARAAFSVPVLSNLSFNAAHFGIWALLGLLIMPVLKRHRLRANGPSWLFHLLFGSVMTITDVTLGHWLHAALTGAWAGHSALQIAEIAVRTCFHIGLLTYFGFVGVMQGIEALALARRREVQVAEHQAARVRAQLHSLKLQLQPHFLFNTLNAIGSLMHYDVASADRMLTRLSDMLRTSLREADKAVVPLREEIAFIEAYVDIEKIRFEERLAVTWSVDPSLLHHPVPPFILQPLVENAVKYGVAPYADGGHITIRARAGAAALILEVENDAGAAPLHMAGLGIGLANTRSRLEALYGEGEHLTLALTDDSTVARISIAMAAQLEAA